MVLVVKNWPADTGDAGDMGLILGSGRSPGGGNGSPLQCSFLENLMDRGAWWAAVQRVTKSWTQMRRMHISPLPLHLRASALLFLLTPCQEFSSSGYLCGWLLLSLQVLA